MRRNASLDGPADSAGGGVSQEGLSEPISLQNLGRRALEGTIWLVAERLYRQGVFLMRALVLGRLLSPSDFGTAGLGELSIYFLGVLTYIGFESALVQRRDLQSVTLHTAWWTGLGRSGIIAAILWFLAPSLAGLFRAPEATAVIRALALITFLSAFNSMGIILLRKELKYKKLFAWEALGLTLDLLVAIWAALIWRSVWALVLGTLAGTLVRMAASYRFHPYKPKLVFEIKAARELFDFGKWLLLSAIMTFIILKGTDVLSGFWFGAAALGLYQMAARFALLPSSHIGETLLAVMFPAYSLIQDNPPRLAAAYIKVLQVTALLVFPLAALLAVAVGPMLPLILGPKWQGVVPLVPWIVLGGAMQALLRTGSPVFLATGRPDCQFAMDLASSLGILALVYPLTHFFGLAGLAGAYAMGISLGFPCWWFFVREGLKIRSHDILLAVIPPGLGSLLLVATVWVGRILLFRPDTWPIPGGLLSLSAVGSGLYLVFILWAERHAVGYQPINASLNLLRSTWVKIKSEDDSDDS